MPLFYHSSSLMDGFGMERILCDSSLESSVQKFVECETQNVIKFELVTRKKTISMHSSQEGRSFKQSSWVFFFKCKELSSCLSKFR